MENESLLETKESLQKLQNCLHQNKVQIKIFWKSCGFCQKSSHDLISKQRPDHGNRLEQAVYLWVDGSLFVWWRREISSLCNLFNNSWWNPASETGLFIYQSDLLTSLHSLNTFYLIFCVNTNFGSSQQKHKMLTKLFQILYSEILNCRFLKIEHTIVWVHAYACHINHEIADCKT